MVGLMVAVASGVLVVVLIVLLRVEERRWAKRDEAGHE
jgi:hypothetical protein